MSQYLEIYMKVKDSYVPLAIYSGSSYMYRCFNEALTIPYEKAVPFSPNCFRYVIDFAAKELKNSEKELNEFDKKVKLIQEMEGSIKEKLELIEEIEMMKKEYLEEDYIEEIKRVIAFCESMLMIADENSYSYSYSPITDLNDMFYIGIECGNPSVNYDDEN